MRGADAIGKKDEANTTSKGPYIPPLSSLAASNTSDEKRKGDVFRIFVNKLNFLVKELKFNSQKIVPLGRKRVSPRRLERKSVYSFQISSYGFN